MYLRISKKNDIDLYSAFYILKKEKFNISGIVEKLISNYADGKDLDTSSFKECLKNDISLSADDKELITIVFNTDKNENISKLFSRCEKRGKTAFAKALLRAAFGTSILKFFFSSTNNETVEDNKEVVIKTEPDNIPKKDEKKSTHNDVKSDNIIKEDIQKKKHEHHNKNKGNHTEKPSWNNKNNNHKDKNSNNVPKKDSNAKFIPTDNDTKTAKPVNKQNDDKKNHSAPLIPDEEYFEKEPKKDNLSGFLASMANWES